MKKLLIISQTTAGAENGIFKTKETLAVHYEKLATEWNVSLLLPIQKQYEKFHTGVCAPEKIRVVSLPRKLFSQIRTFWHECSHADAVFVFMPTWRGVLGGLITALLRKPLAIYEGGAWDQFLETQSHSQTGFRKLRGRILSRLARHMENLLFRCADCALVTGEELQKRFLPYNANTIMTKPILLLEENKTEVRTDYKLHTPLQLLTVGNLSFAKGLDTLIRATAKVRKKQPVHLTCVGAGNDLAALQKIVQESHLEDCVFFPGYENDIQKLAQFYRNADFFILASLSEGMPRVLYEAAHFGLPILTTPVGGVPSFWSDGKDALFLKAGDEEDMANKILSLANSPETRLNIGNAGQQKVIDLLSYPAWKQHLSVLRCLIK